MKRNLLLILLTLLPLVASAYDALIDGIYYNFSGNEAVVTYKTEYNSYSGDVVIPESVIYRGKNYSVTNIGSSAFYKCTGLTSVIIPDNVTSIGGGAFQGCSGLTSITIPSSVTHIGEYAFEGCTRLKKVIVPDIAAWCMIDFSHSTANPSYCAHHIFCDEETEITDLVIPEGVTSIGNNAFFDCNSLTSVTIPNSVKTIGEHAFWYCSALTSVTIPNSVTSIGNYAFYNCGGLTSLNIPNSVTTIGNSAFRECSGLTSVTIPEGVTSIGGAAFGDCVRLTSITIPNSVISMGDDPFGGCSGLRSIQVQSGNTVYDSRNNCNAIIETATRTLVNGCINTIIPNSVTTIGKGAFYGCRMTSVTIPENVTSIEETAFLLCCFLFDVYCYAENAPNTKTDLSGRNVFDSSPISSARLHVPASAIEKYKVASPWNEFGTIVAIENENPNIQFTDAKVKAICIANWDADGDGELSKTEAAAVNSIGEIFRKSEITSFDELQYFTGLTSIDNYAFYECNDLFSITIPNGVSNIGSYTFRYCPDLASINIPNSVTSIGSYAFSGCTRLQSITIPNGVTTIGFGAFSDCSGLTSVTIPNSATNIRGAAFENCAGLTNIVIPDKVTSIPSRLLAGCSGLTSFNIPDAVTSIGNYAFSRCSGLPYIKIPKNVTSIGEYVFSSCRSLTDVFCYADIVPETDVNAFKSFTTATATLYVPASAIEKYKTAEPWSSFGTIVAIESEDTKILFADAKVKAICVANWDADGDGELSKKEAAKVTSLNNIFEKNEDITSFDEFKYFTGVKSLGYSEFSHCSNLTSISLPNSLTYCGGNVFVSCTKLSSIKWPENKKIQLSKGTFQFCTFTSISLPSNIVFEEGVFIQCYYLEEITVDKANPYYQSVDGVVYSKDMKTIIAYPSGREEKEYTIPDGVETIGEDAFAYSKKLNKVNIPTSVKTLGRACFESSKIKSLAIPQGVTEIPGYCCYWCDALTSVTILGNITSIGMYYAFASCHSLTDIYCHSKNTPETDNTTFKDSPVTSITLHVPMSSIEEYKATSPWSEFGTIVPLEGVIGDVFTAKTKEGVTMTFKILNQKEKTCQVGNSEETSVNIETSGQVTIPEEVYGYKVTAIGDKGFYNCSKLTHIWLHENIESIGKLAFYGCTSLRVLDIPHSVVDISEDAFEGCSNLQIKIPTNIIEKLPDFPSGSGIVIVITPPDNTDQMKELERIYIPKAVMNIGERSFSYCKSVKKMEVDTANVVFDSRDNCNAIIRTADNTLLFGCQNTIIPETITAIASYAFEGHSNLKAISIPSGVTAIGEEAFIGCSALEAITSNIKVPYAISDNTFSDVTYKNATLSIPYGTKALYQATPGWKNFMNIVEEEPKEGDEFTDETLEGVKIAFRVISSKDKTCQVKGEYNSPAIDKATLGNITIPDIARGYSVTGIDSYAFYECSGLTSIIIPESVSFIGNQAFDECQLLNVLIKCITPPVTEGKIFFSEQSFYHTILYIPTDSWKAYAFDDSWYKFINIRETATAEEQLNTQQAYTLMDANTFAYSVYDPVNNCIGTISSVGINEDNPNHNWQILADGSQRYLYNIGAKKYARMGARGLELSDQPEAIEIENGESGIVLGEQISQQWAFVSNEHLNADQGIVDEIGSLTPALSKGEGEVYDLNGRRVQQPRNGIYIKNGRKILMQ